MKGSLNGAMSGFLATEKGGIDHSLGGDSDERRRTLGSNARRLMRSLAIVLVVASPGVGHAEDRYRGQLGQRPAADSCPGFALWAPGESPWGFVDFDNGGPA